MSSPSRLTPDVTPEEIHAFIDGELDDARAREVAHAIESDPALRADVAAFREDKAMLAAHYAPVLARPMPDAWLRQIAELQGRRRVHPAVARFVFGANPAISRVRPLLALAASLVFLIAGGITYRTVVSGGVDTAVDRAVAARDNTGGQTVAADAAKVSAALGMALKLPDLTKAGYALAEVVVLPEHGTNAVKIDYRNAANQVFTLYLRASSGREAFDIIKRGDLRICLWQDDVLSTVMMGEMSAAEMLRVASLAYNGLYF